MSTYVFTAFSNSSFGSGPYGFSDGRFRATTPGVTMSVQDDNAVFVGLSFVEETLDTSSQVLVSNIGNGVSVQSIELVYKWTVVNQMTGESGNGYLIRTYENQSRSPNLGKNGQYYRVFDINVSKGDDIVFSNSDYIGKFPYHNVFEGNQVIFGGNSNVLFSTVGSEEFEGRGENDTASCRGSNSDVTASLVDRLQNQAESHRRYLSEHLETARQRV